MIYLIEIPRCKYDNSGNITEYYQILKIGYTNDEEPDINKNKRLATYKNYYGSSMKLLKIIPNATEEQEKKLHYKFKDYLIEGNEWYSYKEEIIDYLSSVTLEELDNLPLAPSMVERDLVITKTITRKILSYVFDSIDEIDMVIEDIMKFIGILNLNEKSILDYLEKNNIDCSNYLDHKKKIETNVFTEDQNLNKTVVKFFEEYDKFTTFYYKLRYLCNCNLNPEVIDCILSQLSNNDMVKICYNKIGPSRLKELGFSITRIRKELGIVLFSPEVLINTIYSNFHVGDKLSLLGIKNQLSNLYSTISYKKTPKATDLEEFFEVKECKVLVTDENGNKKRSRGYELIKSYELEMRIKLEQMNKNN